MKLRALAMVVIAAALTVFASSQTFATTTAKTLPAVRPLGHAGRMGTGRLPATRRYRYRLLGGCSTTRIRALPARRQGGIRQSTPWSLRLSFGDRSRFEHGRSRSDPQGPT